VVRALASRSEFVTAYTPYQPEVAQGVLQAIFEFQTLVSRLSGMPIANASLYDGATGLTEGLNMAAGATGKKTMLISAGVHPHWRAVAKTMAQGTGYTIVEVPLRNGVTQWSEAPRDDVAAVVLAYPNYLGIIEDPQEAKAVATEAESLFIMGIDPVAAGALRSAGEWGADVFVAEGQPFGTGLSFGGPYLGLFACVSEQVRRLPGRIVGETVDSNVRRAYVTTLRAREQDIRREKATSNICSNQTLMAVTMAVQLGWLGTEGLRAVATSCAQGAHYLFDELLMIPGVSAFSDAPFFREFAISVPKTASELILALADEGFLAGVSASSLTGGTDASYDGSGENILILTVTERRTKEQCDAFVAAVRKVVA
jgi:glycine dehydrogenase subunit 1